MKGSIRISKLGDLWVLAEDVANLMTNSQAMSVFTDAQILEIRDGMNLELKRRKQHKAK